jgi:sugar-specific transcriptional regulator TrmB
MPRTPSAVDQAATLLKERIAELESELAKLKRALVNLSDGPQARRRPGRPRGSGRGTNRGRRRGLSRAEQAVKVIQQNPGISAAEIARKMSIQPTYLYRVLGDLQKQGTIKKAGRTYTSM